MRHPRCVILIGHGDELHIGDDVSRIMSRFYALIKRVSKGPCTQMESPIGRANLVHLSMCSEEFRLPVLHCYVLIDYKISK